MEKIPYNVHEKTPTDEEIFRIIGRLGEEYVIKKHLFDREGTYLLEAQATNTETREIVQYRYTRKGKFQNLPEESETAIHATYLNHSGNLISSIRIAVLDASTGKLKDKRFE